MSSAVCMDCGTLYAPAGEGPFCGLCEDKRARAKPHDVTRDAWGRRFGSSDMACFSDGNCLRMAIATALQVEPARVPDPELDFIHSDWLERFDERLKRQLGVRLEKIPPGACPPIGRTNWIAVLRRETSDHAVLARDHVILHDSEGKRLNGLGVRGFEIAYGLRILPASAPRRDSWGRKIA